MTIFDKKIKFFVATVTIVTYDEETKQTKSETTKIGVRSKKTPAQLIKHFSTCDKIVDLYLNGDYQEVERIVDLADLL